jgi:hypothetical protein
MEQFGVLLPTLGSDMADPMRPSILGLDEKMGVGKRNG